MCVCVCVYEDAGRDLPQCAPSSAASATQSVSESQTLASGMQWCVCVSVCVCVCVCVCTRMQGETYHNVLLHRLHRPHSRSVSRRRWPVECSGVCV